MGSHQSLQNFVKKMLKNMSVAALHVVDADSVLLIAAVTKGLMEYLSTVKHIKVKDS